MFIINNIKTITKGRKFKTCGICENEIPKGTKHYVATLYNGNFHTKVACSNGCVKRIKALADGE